MPQICLILFGSPGSGKGTQAKMLKEGLGVAHISTGDMLRERVALGDALGRRVAGIIKAGGLVPDDAVNRMVEDRITLEDCTRGFILDGYPRTVTQAKWLAGRLAQHELRPLVVHLEVDYDVIVARISGRRQCPFCGTLYNLATSPGKVACDLEGAKLEIREDDREDVVRARLRAYDAQTAPVLEYFRKTGYSCLDVSGSNAPDRIADEIREWISAQTGEAAA